MGSAYGNNIKVEIFGESHSPSVGVTVCGLPVGKSVDVKVLQYFLDRRAPGKAPWSSPRREADRVMILSGINDGRINGEPLKAVIENTDVKPGDYSEFANTPRPGHADYTAWLKNGKKPISSGGGAFSGRMTAPLCIAGGICIQLLKELGIELISRIYSISDIVDNGALISSTADKSFPTLDDNKGAEMINAILEAKAAGDSVGGVIECAILGLDGGIGGPLFDGMEGRIAQAVFAIPAVKGIEFGLGFELTKLRGSEANDPFYIENGRVLTKTNNCGGILGGITDGMPLSFKAAIKPTPSIALAQETVNLGTMKNTRISVRGRHDPCIVPRAVPCVEAAAALAVYDAILDSERNSNGA